MSQTHDHIIKISNYAEGNLIILAFVTREYAKVALNWAVGLGRLGVTNYVIYCFDADSHSFLSERGIQAVKGNKLTLPISISWWRKLRYSLGLLTADDLYEETDFSEIWKSRFQILVGLLESGVEVIHSDLDAVWLKDPVNRFVDSYPNYDVIGSIVEHAGAFPPKVRDTFGFTICMGFICFRPTKDTLRFLHELYDRLGDDQEEFNHMLLERNPTVNATEFGYELISSGIKVGALGSKVVNRGGRELDSYVCHPNSPKLGESTRDVLRKENLWFL